MNTPTKRKAQPTLKQLQTLWYAKLASTGFKDIERTDHPERPLRVYHSFHFLKEANQPRRQEREVYQAQAEAFKNDESFLEVCKLAVGTNNKGARSTANDAKLVWDMHCQGFSVRKIATETHLSKSCVHKLIKRLEAWMKLL